MAYTTVVYPLDGQQWSSEETSILLEGLKSYPETQYSQAWRCIKIAATLKGKTVRDVAGKLKELRDEYNQTLMSSTAESEQMMNALLQDNMLSLYQMQENLVGFNLEDNKDVMSRFAQNHDKLLEMVGSADVDMPMLPTQLDLDGVHMLHKLNGEDATLSLSI